MSKRTAVAVREGNPSALPALPLSPKEREFCDAYFAGEHAGNATRSYLVVYPDASYATASVEASDLLKEPEIRCYLEQLHAKAIEVSARQLREWSELLPMAQSVIIGTAEGRVRNRLAYEAAVHICARVLGTPTNVASTEVVVRDGRRIAKAVEMFHKRLASQRQLKAGEAESGDGQL